VVNGLILSKKYEKFMNNEWAADEITVKHHTIPPPDVRHVSEYHPLSDDDNWFRERL
jgi:hypothetical protein